MISSWSWSLLFLATFPLHYSPSSPSLADIRPSLQQRKAQQFQSFLSYHSVTILSSVFSSTRKNPLPCCVVRTLIVSIPDTGHGPIIVEGWDSCCGGGGGAIDFQNLQLNENNISNLEYHLHLIVGLPTPPSSSPPPSVGSTGKVGIGTGHGTWHEFKWPDANRPPNSYITINIFLC